MALKQTGIYDWPCHSGCDSFDSMAKNRSPFLLNKSPSTLSSVVRLSEIFRNQLEFDSFAISPPNEESAEFSDFNSQENGFSFNAAQNEFSNANDQKRLQCPAENCDYSCTLSGVLMKHINFKISKSTSSEEWCSHINIMNECLDLNYVVFKNNAYKINRLMSSSFELMCRDLYRKNRQESQRALSVGGDPLVIFPSLEDQRKLHFSSRLGSTSFLIQTQRPLDPYDPYRFQCPAKKCKHNYLQIDHLIEHIHGLVNASVNLFNSQRRKHIEMVKSEVCFFRKIGSEYKINSSMISSFENFCRDLFNTKYHRMQPKPLNGLDPIALFTNLLEE